MFLEPWMLMEDGTVVGNNGADTIHTTKVIDITPLYCGMSLLETEFYDYELGNPMGRCGKCGRIGVIEDTLCPDCLFK